MPSTFQDNPFRVDRVNSSADYRPDWDVPSLNRMVSDAICRVIEDLRQSPEVNAGRKIPVLLGPSGYGKTHLYGRIRHACGDQVLVVFIPQIEDVTKPLQHLRFHLIESLFGSLPGETPLIRHVLARLCQDSFKSYFEFLPPAVRHSHATLWGQLETDPKVILDIIAPVKELAAFDRVGISLADRYPHLQTDVLRALALGWSPVANEVRRWLRGESMTTEDPESFGLKPEPPEATPVFQAVATLLARIKVPLVICWDQMEKVLKEGDALRHISTDLIKLLQEVPNLLIVLSCFSDEWKRLSGPSGVYQSFLRRTKEHELNGMNPDQAIELVERRLKDWHPDHLKEEPTWPFRRKGLKEFVDAHQPKPSGLLRVLADDFEEWLGKEPQKWIERIPNRLGVSLDVAFLEAWNKELDLIEQEKVSSEHQQQDRLYRSIKEALLLWKEGKKHVDGVELLGMEEPATRAAAVNDAQLHLASGNRSFRVIVGVTKETKGNSFGSFLNGLDRYIQEPILGAVLVRPTNALGFGTKANARTAYQKLVDEKKLRPYSLLDHTDAFRHLECLLRFLDRAGTDLVLSNQAISLEQCKSLILETKVLENLSLFSEVFTGWVEASAVSARKVEAKTLVSAATAATRTPPAELPVGPGRQPRGPGTPPPPPPPAKDTIEVWAADLLHKMCKKLTDWGQAVKPHGYEIGPTFARFKVYPQGQTDFARVQRKAENLKINLALPAVPVIGAQSGHISLDVQLPERRVVTLRETLCSDGGKDKGQPSFPLGMDVAGHTHWLNLADPSTCHLLVAGTTGSGKSELLRSIMAALAYRLSTDEVQFLLIDPKLVTFNFTGESPYFLRPIAHTVEEAIPLVEHCFEETRRRYELLQSKQLQEVGQLRGNEALPRIVVIFDEFADLMLDKETRRALEQPLRSIGALARAAGIHLILATQRPEAQVVTPLLRANLPARISLRVATSRESRLILDEDDAALLLGKGDLFWKCGAGLIRLQCPLTRPHDLERILKIN
jgi:S-DNA-T family DNA segregation ATPase FtsK/SpoIIIE